MNDIYVKDKLLIYNFKLLKLLSIKQITVHCCMICLWFLVWKL